ncbi:MAG: 50S ribosomal protein L20 [Verrucomicrobiales bacterium]|jgi:large subunit ribosomal protein L20|nr:50S ribosomal protein L20 [Verrucomicrobiales bacterium]MBP9225981.1 50S ribosomal protein L20 [Verrucomicrobiales bacterium]HQZ27210.1 50S ribosomal protein L20 [Verrucomicrobiales bacterium]
MPRATNSPASRKRRKRILMKAKGFRGSRSKLIRTAKDAVYKAQAWAYRDRKVRKRTFRGLWIQRINAAAKLSGMTYSRFMEGLKAAEIDLDRKVLSDLAITDAEAFAALVGKAKEALENKAKQAA